MLLHGKCRHPISRKRIWLNATSEDSGILEIAANVLRLGAMLDNLLSEALMR